jgi:hypothetical protein
MVLVSLSDFGCSLIRLELVGADRWHGFLLNGEADRVDVNVVRDRARNGGQACASHARRVTYSKAWRVSSKFL